MGDEAQDRRSGFWSTLPGILTGSAALITAATGGYLAFHSSSPPAANVAAPAALAETPPTNAAAVEPAAAEPNASINHSKEVQATVVDPDGWTNLRAGPSASAAIVGRIDEGEIFWTRPRASLWWPARTEDGLKGYVHRSRVRLNP
jgi:hypothetical protein